MTKFLPIFPLNTVVFPGQALHLHIFEPRYKQLISECWKEKKNFGIPSVNKDNLSEYGAEMEITEVTKVYETGEMDIKTKATGIFRIIDVVREVPDKLYSAAVVYEVKYLPYDTTHLNPTLEDLMKKLHLILKTGFDLRKKFPQPLSFDLAHYAVLTPEDQYRLLTGISEKGRQWFLIQHLQKVIPELEAAEQVRSKVQLNGHFRREVPPNF